MPGGGTKAPSRFALRLVTDKMGFFVRSLNLSISGVQCLLPLVPTTDGSAAQVASPEADMVRFFRHSALHHGDAGCRKDSFLDRAHVPSASQFSLL